MGHRGPKDFFGSKILVKRDIFWVYKRRRDFLGHEKNTLQGFLWVILYLSSAQINNNKLSAIYCLCEIFLCMLETWGSFWVDKF